MSVSKSIRKNMVIIKLDEMGSSCLAKPAGIGEKATADKVVCIREHAYKPSTSDLYLWLIIFWRINTFSWDTLTQG